MADDGIDGTVNRCRVAWLAAAALLRPVATAGVDWWTGVMP
jgi:hypothetical protein